MRRRTPQKVGPVKSALPPKPLDKLCRVLALANVIAAKHAKQGRQSEAINRGNHHGSQVRPRWLVLSKSQSDGTDQATKRYLKQQIVSLSPLWCQTRHLPA